MCGIAGVIILNGRRAGSLEAIGPMAQTVRHRGPDGVNAWLSPSGRCALGHTRLSVIDLELGDQPMANEDGSVQVVFNGEIYNHRALRTEWNAPATASALRATLRCWLTDTNSGASMSSSGSRACSHSGSGMSRRLA